MTCTTISEADPEIAGIGVSLCAIFACWSSFEIHNQIILAFAIQALISLALSITAKVLETPDLRTPDLRNFLLREIQITRDATEAPRDTSLPASVRLRNAALLFVSPHVETTNRFIPVGSWFRTTRAEFNSTMMQYSNEFQLLIHEITNTFAEGDEVGTGLREVTVDPPSKEAVRFARKQGLICQVLIASSDAQTMTGICLTRNDVGWALCWFYALLLLGIALTITAIAQAASLSMYHLHMWVIWAGFE